MTDEQTRRKEELEKEQRLEDPKTIPVLQVAMFENGNVMVLQREPGLFALSKMFRPQRWKILIEGAGGSRAEFNFDSRRMRAPLKDWKYGTFPKQEPTIEQRKPYVVVVVRDEAHGWTFAIGKRAPGSPRTEGIYDGGAFNIWKQTRFLALEEANKKLTELSIPSEQVEFTGGALKPSEQKEPPKPLIQKPE